MQGVHAFYETLRWEPFIHARLKQQPYGDWEFGCVILTVTSWSSVADG
jgi:hypothetical protein